MYQEKLKIDWITIALYAAIMIFGWMNIYSACYEESHAAIFDFSQFHGKQLIWMGLALLTAAVIMLTEPRVFSNMSYPIYGIVLGLLVLTLFLAVTVNGGKSWIDLGGFRFHGLLFPLPVDTEGRI